MPETTCQIFNYLHIIKKYMLCDNEHLMFDNECKHS